MQKKYTILGLSVSVLLLLYLAANPISVSLFESVYIPDLALLQIAIIIVSLWPLLCPEGLKASPLGQVLYGCLPAEALLFLLFSQRYPWLSAAYLCFGLAACWILRKKTFCSIARFTVYVFFLSMLMPAAAEVVVYGMEKPRLEALQTVWSELFTVHPADTTEVELETAPYLEKLNETTWSGLSEKDKLSVLQAVAVLESAKLGVTTPPTIVITPLPPGTIGQYSYADGEIWIDTNYLNTASSPDLVATLAHEIYHCAQEEAVAAIDWSRPITASFDVFQQPRIWRNEYLTYSTSSETYSKQTLEISANQYSAMQVPFYNKYFNP